jgi:hypothetical protein
MVSGALSTVTVTLEWGRWNSYADRMARPKYSPATDDERRVLAVLLRLGKRRKRLQEEIDAALAEARDLDMPVAVAADAVGMDRKTVYRHTGKPMG